MTKKEAMKFETVEPELGQDGFYRHSTWEILPAKVVKKPVVKEERTVAPDEDKVVHKKTIKVDILVFGAPVGDQIEPKPGREVGIKVGCWWPNLAELETAIDYERKQRDAGNKSEA